MQHGMNAAHIIERFLFACHYGITSYEERVEELAFFVSPGRIHVRGSHGRRLQIAIGSVGLRKHSLD